MTEALSTIDYLTKLREKAPEDVLKLTTSMAYAEERKWVSVHVPEELKFKTLELYHLTDVQWGHVCCNKKMFHEYLNFILAEPNRFVLFGGDMIDAATMLSKGTPWDNTGTPIEQIYDFVQVCMPIRHRIIGYVGGNHERHTRPTLGRGAGSLIATHLGIPYSEGQQFIRIWYGDWKPFKINLWHGRGAARTDGAMMMMLADWMNKGDANLYLVGHLHNGMTRTKYRIKDNVKGKVIGLEKYAGAMSGSFLEFFGGYGEIAGLNPTDVVVTRCTLYPNRQFDTLSR